jgi:hypothetical protein
VTTPPEPAAPPPANAGLEQRVGAIEGKLDKVLGFLDKTPDAPAAPAEPERPEVNIAEEIRKQLEERDKSKPAAPAEPAAPAAAELAEKVPVPVARGIEKFMGWAE